MPGFGSHSTRVWTPMTRREAANYKSRHASVQRPARRVGQHLAGTVSQRRGGDSSRQKGEPLGPPLQTASCDSKSPPETRLWSPLPLAASPSHRLRHPHCRAAEVLRFRQPPGLSFAAPDYRPGRPESPGLTKVERQGQARIGRREEDGRDTPDLRAWQAEVGAPHGRGREPRREARPGMEAAATAMREGLPRRASADGGRAGGWAGGGVRPGAGRAERREGRCLRWLFPVAGYIARSVEPAQKRPGALRLASGAAPRSPAPE